MKTAAASASPMAKLARRVSSDAGRICRRVRQRRRYGLERDEDSAIRSTVSPVEKFEAANRVEIRRRRDDGNSNQRTTVGGDEGPARDDGAGRGRGPGRRPGRVRQGRQARD